MRTELGRRVVVALLTGCWALAVACSTFDASESQPTLPEAGSGSDASPDSAPVPDATPTADGGRFCDSTKDASFCADFDVGDLTSGFTPFVTDSGSVARIDSSQSPPNALLSVAEATGKPPLDAAADDGGGSVAALVVNVVRPVTSPGAALDVDVRLDELPVVDGGFASVLSLGFTTGTQAVTLVASGSGMVLVIADPSLPKRGVFVPVAPTSATGWIHLRLEVSFVGAGTRLFIDKVLASDTPNALKSNASGYSVTIGVFARAENRAKVAYDNVVVTPL
jgi:hypothetical protein